MAIAANASPDGPSAVAPLRPSAMISQSLGPILMKAASHPEAPAQISWEQILSNLDDGVITADPSGIIRFFNEASEILTQVSSAAATGQTLELSLIHISEPTR